MAAICLRSLRLAPVAWASLLNYALTPAWRAFYIVAAVEVPPNRIRIFGDLGRHGEANGDCRHGGDGGPHQSSTGASTARYVRPRVQCPFLDKRLLHHRNHPWQAGPDVAAFPPLTSHSDLSARHSVNRPDPGETAMTQHRHAMLSIRSEFPHVKHFLKKVPGGVISRGASCVLRPADARRPAEYPAPRRTQRRRDDLVGGTEDHALGLHAGHRHFGPRVAQVD